MPFSSWDFSSPPRYAAIPVIPVPLTNFPYIAQGLFFDGASGIRGTIQPSSNTSKISFAGWFRSNWTPGTIWTTDPANISRPRLKIAQPAFVGRFGALEDITGINANAGFVWSPDGLKWNVGKHDLPAQIGGFNCLFGPGVSYARGTWMANMENLFPPPGRWILYSSNGQDWSTVYASAAGDATYRFNSSLSRWEVRNAPGSLVATVAVPAILTNTQADDPGPVADSSQAGVPSQFFAVNSLPIGWTAMRNVAGTFQYTTQIITAAIVNNDPQWSTANWITTYSFPNGNTGLDNANNDMLYTGIGSGSVEFCQGDGSGDTLSIKNANLVPKSWVHLMGSIDALLGQAVFVMNGQITSQTPSAVGNPFGSVSTNLKNFYFGTDTKGNFYTGDMADVSVWFDVSWISGGTIPQNIIDCFIRKGHPVDPSIGFTTIGPDGLLLLRGLPQFFISGPARLLFGGNARNNLISLDQVVPDAGFVGDSTLNVVGEPI